MAEIKGDTFTEGSNTALESHTSDTSGGWGGWNTTRMDVIAADDEVADDGTDTAQQWALGDESPSSADYSCTVNGRAVGSSSTHWIGPVIRGNGTNEDGYYVQLAGDGNSRMFKIVATSITQLDSDFASGISESTYADVLVKAVGTAITGEIESVERFSVTDSDISAAGELGITLRRSGRITSLTSDDLVVAGGIEVLRRRMEGS